MLSFFMRRAASLAVGKSRSMAIYKLGNKKPSIDKVVIHSLPPLRSLIWEIPCALHDVKRSGRHKKRNSSLGSWGE